MDVEAERHFEFGIRIRAASPRELLLSRSTLWPSHPGLSLVRIMLIRGLDSFLTLQIYLTLVSSHINRAFAVQTLVYAFRWDGTFPLQRWPRFLQFLHILLYSTVTTFRAYPILQYVCRLLRRHSSHSNRRDVVFWSLLSSPATFATTFSSTFYSLFSYRDERS